MTPRLTIRIKKNADGTAALTCTRADGSVTWQRQQGTQGMFFPRHDLTHFAVETVLGHRRGFYGLVADGWDSATSVLHGHADRCQRTWIRRSSSSVSSTPSARAS